MEITAKTRVSAILKKYGDIAEIMEVFGIKKVGVYGLHKFIANFITVKTAEKVHSVPLEEFLKILNKAVEAKWN